MFSFRKHESQQKREFKKQLRRRSTIAERRLRSRLVGKQFGAKFNFQAFILGWIVDFYCPHHRLVVEVDGSSHDNKQDRDAHRDQVMRDRGFIVLRLTNREIFEDIESALSKIRTAMKSASFTRSYEFDKEKRKYQAYISGRAPLSSRLY